MWCRQYEQELLAAGADKGVEKVRSLYHRQLQVPLQGNVELLEEYEAWEKSHGKVRGFMVQEPRGSRGCRFVQAVCTGVSSMQWSKHVF